MPRKKDDMLLKSAFEEVFPDLLRFFFPQADDMLDMERGFVFLDKELMELFPEAERKGGNRIADMLARVFLKNGREEWFLIHLEIQGPGAGNFPQRMHQYWYRIYDRYGVDITALAVFTGGHSQKRKAALHKSFLGTEISYRYNTYHIFDHSAAELLAMQNSFAPRV